VSSLPLDPPNKSTETGIVFGLCLWLLFAIAPLSGNEGSHDHYILKTWDGAQGAPTNRINDLVEAEDGFLWLATYEGLIRFDGIEHRIFNHQNHPALVGGILNILESPAGSLWMVSTAGSLLRLREGEFTVWTAEDGFPAERAERLVGAPDGGPLLYSPRGFVVIDEADRIVPWSSPGLPPVNPITFSFDKAGTLWIAPTGGGLWAYADGRVEEFVPVDLGAPGNRVNGIFPQADGSLWLGMDRGVALFQPDVGTLRFFPADEFWVHDRNLRMAYRGEPLLLGGNTLGSLHVFSPEGIRPFSWGPLREPTETVNALTPLRDGGFAIATYSQGLLFLIPGHFPFFNRQNGLEGVLINSIRPYEEGRWLIANNLGTQTFDGRSFTPLEIDGEPFAEYTVDVLHDSAGRLWIGTIGRGLFLRENGEWRHFGRRNGLRSNTIRALEEDSMGNIWIGTRLGLYRWHNGFIEEFGLADGLRSEYILSLYVDAADRLWIGTVRGGVHLLENGRIEADPGNNGAAFANRTIFSFHTDREGRIWGGMSGGIFSVEEERIHFINLYERFDVDSVFHVMDDRLGSFWLTSSRGLWRVPYDDLVRSLRENFRLDDRVRLFSRRDGLPSDAMRPVSRMHRDERGRLWFPTENGFFILDPADLPVAQTIPAIYIDEVKINGQQLGNQWFFRHKEYALPPHLHRIEFSYTSPNFQLLDREHFRVRLRGFEDEWRETRLRYAVFTNLAPGDYVFEVAVGNGEDLWSDSPTTFAFTVRPAFHQTAGFYLLIALLIIAAIALYVRQRTWSLRQRQQELIALVDERTREIRAGEAHLAESNKTLRQLNQEKNQFLAIAAHDLRNPIGAIEGCASLIETECAEMEKSAGITSIRECAQLILESTGRMSGLIGNLLDIHRIEQGLTVANLDQVCIAAAIEDALHSHRQRAHEKRLGLDLQLPPPSSVCVMADRDLLTQILDNLISNAIKYCPRDRTIHIYSASGEKADPPTVRVFVRDEGCGLPPEEMGRLFQKFSRLSNRPTEGEGSTGLGLSIARHFTEMMHGRIGAENAPEGGAIFWVELPGVTSSTSLNSTPKAALS
jgi:signal transduction histidine kinase/ligand-binding sensor domain-containing protein